MTTIDLEVRRHASRVLNDWVSARPGAVDRIGGGPLVRNDVTDGSGVISSSDRTAMLDLFSISASAAGVSVTPESAMRVSTVFACVQKICGALSSLPLKQYERINGGRDRREVPDAPYWYLLNEEPTPRFSAASHWENVGINSLQRGDSFTFIGRSISGAIKELVPLPWPGVRVERSDGGGGNRLKYFIQDGLQTWGADQDDILHFPGFGFDGLRGMSVIKWAARNATGSAAAMDEYSGRFFAGGAHPSIVLETPNKMNEKLIGDLQAAFAAKYSGIDNLHKLPLVLTEGLKATTLSLSAEDSQLLEARKFQVLDIARAYGVPPHLVGETSGSTSWGSGLEEMMRAFVAITLQPHLKRFEQELNRKLFRTARFFVEFDREALLAGNSEGQAKRDRAALGGPGQGPGYMSVDEVRAGKNLPPLGGRCAEVYFPPLKAPETKPEEDDDEKTAAAAA